MKTITKFLGGLLALSLVALPVVPAMAETAQGGALTLADFQRSVGGKPVQAWEAYRQYQYRLAHPSPKPILEVSRMRSDMREKTLTDFQREFPKPNQAAEAYQRYQVRKSVLAEAHVYNSFVSTGKPSADWLKQRS